jgi:hypothetical protein
MRNLVVNSLSPNPFIGDTLDRLAIPIAFNELRSLMAEVRRGALKKDARGQDHGGRGVINAHADGKDSTSVVNERDSTRQKKIVQSKTTTL